MRMPHLSRLSQVFRLSRLAALSMAALLTPTLMGCGGGTSSGTGVRGIATRQDTGQPLPNADIRLRELDADDNNILKANGHEARTTTNGQGRFAVAIAPGRYSMGGQAYNVSGVPDKNFQSYQEVTLTAGGYQTVNPVFIAYDNPTIAAVK